MFIELEYLCGKIQRNKEKSLNAREGILFIEHKLPHCWRSRRLSSLNAREGILFIELDRLAGVTPEMKAMS